jgi:hypothetical protein
MAVTMTLRQAPRASASAPSSPATPPPSSPRRAPAAPCIDRGRPRAIRPRRSTPRHFEHEWSMTTTPVHARIEASAAELRRLHAEVKRTFRETGGGHRAVGDWERACELFDRRYDALAFPGGYDGALRQIEAGDPKSVESALCFLEVRPYFFRSGYMWRDILRKLRRARLPPHQAARLAEIESAYALHRQARAHAKSAAADVP